MLETGLSHLHVARHLDLGSEAEDTSRIARVSPLVAVRVGCSLTMSARRHPRASVVHLGVLHVAHLGHGREVNTRGRIVREVTLAVSHWAPHDVLNLTVAHEMICQKGQLRVEHAIVELASIVAVGEAPGEHDFLASGGPAARIGEGVLGAKPSRWPERTPLSRFVRRSG